MSATKRPTKTPAKRAAKTTHSKPPTLSGVPFVVMPYTLHVVRFLFDDGAVLDVESPHNDSRVAGFALLEATRLWGKRADRRIDGSTVIGRR